MTLEQVKALTDDEIRIKVAELMGWERFPDKDMPFGHTYWARFEHGHFKKDTTEHGNKLPDWPRDLNACSEMEKTLWHTPEMWLNYVNLLQTRKDYDNGAACAWVSATARQRCEAFILTREEVRKKGKTNDT